MMTQSNQMLVDGDPVAGPGLGQDQRRAVRPLELGPQPPDVDPDVLGLGLVPPAPDPAQQMGPRQQLAPVQRELPQQRELGRREVHLLAPQPHHLARQVDLDLADLDHRRRGLDRPLGRPGPAERGQDAREQLLDAERLGHVVVGAHVERGHLVPLAAPGRHHDDRDRGMLADLPAELEPVDLGQHQVEQHHVRLLGLQHRQRLGAVGRHQRVEPAHGQVRPDQVDDVRVVLDDEHPGRRGELGHLNHEGFSTGRVIRKDVPQSAGCSSILPRCAATIPAAMDSTSPAPARALGRRTTRPPPARAWAGRPTPAASTSCQRGSRPRAASVTARASSGGNPSPSSATRTLTWSGPAAWAVTTTLVCGGLCVSALPTRFTKTCSSRSWSAQIAGSPGVALTSTSEAASGGSTAMAASSTSGMSHQSPCSRNTPDSIAEKSSRSLTSRPSRADSAAIRDRNRCSEAGSQVTSCCSREVAYPVIAVSGVRSSWLSLRRNVCCSSRECRSAIASWCATSARSRSSAIRSEWAASSSRSVASSRRSPSAHDESSTVRPAGAANVTHWYRPVPVTPVATPSGPPPSSAALAAAMVVAGTSPPSPKPARWPAPE